MRFWEKHDAKSNEVLVEKLDTEKNKNIKVDQNESLNNVTAVDPTIPIFTLDDLTPIDVHDMTGYMDVLELIEAVVIICGGNLHLMTKTNYRWE